MDRNGGHVTRLTFTGAHHRIVGISPSKRHLVVTRADEDTQLPSGLGDEDRTNLWLLDLETKTETRLTDKSNTAEGDSFSPDGEWIVFWMVVAGEAQGDIYKIRRDGSALTRLTSTADATEGDPTWSHDGNHIFFVSYSTGAQRFVLKAMDADGDDVRTIYDGGDTISTPRFPPGAYDPSCSPDGQSIVFSARFGPADPGAVQIEVFTMDPDGGALQKLTQAPAYDDFTTWIW